MYPFPFVGQAAPSPPGSDVFVAVGWDSNGVGTGVTDTVATASTDGTSWTVTTPIASATVTMFETESISYDDSADQFLAAGRSCVAWSNDGVTWVGTGLGVRPWRCNGASGLGDYIIADFPGLWYRLDASPSIVANGIGLGGGAGYAFFDAHYAAGQWVMAGNRSHYALTNTPSANGDWTLINTISYASVWYSVPLSQWLMTGFSNNVARSADGVTWFTAGTGLVGPTVLRECTFGNGLWVAVGDNGVIITSPDGLSWTAQTSGVAVRLTGVTYSDTLGLFAACGFSGTILTSPDAVTWTPQTSGTNRNLYEIICKTARNAT